MKNYWLNSLLLSALIHVLLIFAVFFSPFPAKPKEKIQKTKEIEIISEKPQKKAEVSKREESIKNEPLPYKENIIDKLLDAGKSRPVLDKIKQTQVQSENIFLSDFSQEENFKENPAYMNYYRMVREKIRKNSYQSYKGRGQGKVYLNFSISKDGSLRAIGFGGESTKNAGLKKIALSSIKKSAPFPSFPEELKKYSQLNFNISIYFKSK